MVGGLLPYAMLSYRHRLNDANATQEPAQIYGSNQIELSWTVIPILIVVMLFLATARVVYANEHARKPVDALNVSGHTGTACSLDRATAATREARPGRRRRPSCLRKPTPV